MHFRKGIAAYNAVQQGSSMQIRRVLLMPEPSSIDANEITDKGYINQRGAGAALCRSARRRCDRHRLTRSSGENARSSAVEIGVKPHSSRR